MDRGFTSWLTERHSLRTEGAVVLGAYALYETARGLVAGDPAAAVRHAHAVAAIERSLHVFDEARVQHAVTSLPGVVGVLGALYLTMHFAGTGAFLVWLHRRRPDAFALVRTTLLIASGLALVGYITFPTAPPRLAALGIRDTISNGQVDLNHGLVSALYNPFAAVPSMHIGFAVIVGSSLVIYGGRRSLRVLGTVYPLLVLLVIVATGNHFFFDAAAGAFVAAIAFMAARSAQRVRVPAPANTWPPYGAPAPRRGRLEASNGIGGV